MSAIFKRELRAYFTSPIGYVVLAVCWIFSAWSFYDLYKYGAPMISYVFGQLFLIVLFMIPILTMRLMSDDKRQKTDQILLTSPVRLSSIVFGKFLSALTIFGIAISGTVIFQIIIATQVQTASAAGWPVFFGNLVGTLLLGASLIAIGVFISSLTESQVVAAVASFAVSLFLIMMNWSQTQIQIAWIAAVLKWFSYQARYNEFTQGVFNYSNVLFFLSITAVFLFLTVNSLNKKRWA